MTIEIANRLLELRKKSGLSQEELADKLGVSRQAVSKWERAESSPDTDNLICLAKIYGVSLDEILSTDMSVEEIAEDKAMEQGAKKETKKETKEETKEEAKEEPKAEEAESREILEGEVVDADDPDADEDYEGEDRGRSSWFAMSWLGPLSVLAYILTGIFWVAPSGFHVGWAAGWTLLLLPVVITGFISAIRSRNPNHFPIAVLVVITYVGGGIIGNAYGVNLWHPYWVEFFAIPIYHGFCNAIRAGRRAKIVE